MNRASVVLYCLGLLLLLVANNSVAVIPQAKIMVPVHLNVGELRVLEDQFAKEIVVRCNNLALRKLN